MIGYKELSERWGVPRDRLYVWKTRGKLPAYDIEEGTHPARVVGWHESTIEELEGGHNGGMGTDNP